MLNNQTPPDLLSMFINLFLSPNHVINPIFPSQYLLHISILLIVSLCIPFILMGKPIYIYYQLKCLENKYGMNEPSLSYYNKYDKGKEEEEEEKALVSTQVFSLESVNDGLISPSSSNNVIDSIKYKNERIMILEGQDTFFDLIIHQVIYTIEYLLGKFFEYFL